MEQKKKAVDTSMNDFPSLTCQHIDSWTRQEFSLLKKHRNLLVINYHHKHTCGSIATEDGAHRGDCNHKRRDQHLLTI